MIYFLLFDFKYVVGLFAKSLDGVNVKDLITNVGSSAGAAPAAGGAPAGEAPSEKKGKANLYLYADTILRCVQVYLVTKII